MGASGESPIAPSEFPPPEIQAPNEDQSIPHDMLERVVLGPPSASLRFKFFLTGCLFPASCAAYVFFADATPTLGIPWQSGLLEDHVAMLLSWRCQLVFLPLIAYSIFSLAAWLIWPGAQRKLLVRMGIYAGVPLAGQYLFFFIATSSVITLICAAIVGPLLALLVFLVGYFLKRIRRFSILHLLFFMTFVASICGLLQMTDSWRRLLESPLIIAAATPTLNFLTYLRAAIMIAAAPKPVSQPPRSGALAGLLASLLITGAWSASWKIALDIMVAEYAQLPSTRPNCYLSAAAQHRHSWLFNESTNGVSLQTKRLKFLEIALRCAAPNLHAALRRSYDCFGPPLANFCKKSPWFADVTYLAIVPVECLAILLHRHAGVAHQEIEKLYSSLETAKPKKSRF